MDKILGVLGGVPQSKTRNDDDFSDRLSHRFSTALFVVFAVIVSTKQYVGDPITCWVPAHFTGNHEEYTNNYCWVKNTYYLPFEEYIPKEHEEDKRQMIPYYQWMPMILLIQGLLYYMPVMVWRSLNGRSGIDLNSIVESGESFQNTEKADSREGTLKYMVKQMDRYLTSRGEYRAGCTVSIKHLLASTIFRWCGRRKGNYLVSLYLVVKLLYIANVLMQLFVLNHFLGQTFHMFGIEVIRAILRGNDWTESARFPRVTMCDFKVRRLGNVQRYTVQCVLPINLFNEKIYLFLWFWMLFLVAMLTISLLKWGFRSAFRVDLHRYVKKHLRMMNVVTSSDSDKKILARFVDKYLRPDGVFVLRLVGHNTNAITVTEFVCALYENYKLKPEAETASRATLEEHTSCC